MATASETTGEGRPGRRQPESTGSLSGAILSAINESGLSHYEIGMRSGVDNSLLSAFVRGEVGLGPSSVDKLCDFFGIKVVPASETASDDPSEAVSDAMRRAIADRGLSSRRLAELLGICHETINRFLRREGGLRLSTADQVCDVLKLRVVCVPAARLFGSNPGTMNTARPIGDALRQAFADLGHDECSLPKATGLNRETIRRFYDPRSDISLSTAESLCDFSGISVAREKAAPDDPPQTVSDAIRSEIEERRLSPHALARATRLDARAIGRFCRREGGLRLSTGESLCDFFGFRVVRIPAARSPEPTGLKPLVSDALRRAISDALRRAISDRGLESGAVVKLSDLSPTTIYFFLNGNRILNYNSLLKLADALEVDISPLLERPNGGQLSPGDPPVDPPDAAGPGTFDPREMERLTEHQRELVALINSHEPEGCSGAFLEGATKVSSHRYHLNKIAGLSEYWRARVDFPVKRVKGKEHYRVRIN